MTSDAINALFELGGASVLVFNVMALHRDKKTLGVHIVPTAFFMTWGWWNLVFYPSVNAWWSFYGGILVTLVNTVWVGQMFWYRWVKKWWFDNAGLVAERRARRRVSDIFCP